MVTEARKERTARWREAHKEQIKAYQRAYYLSHRDEAVAYRVAHAEARRAHDAAHREEKAASRKAYGDAHKSEASEHNARQKIDAINAYGGPICACCGETMLEGLTIDHINGDGAKHRREVGHGTGVYRWLRRNNYPPGFQVLCFTCNCAKGTGDHCPHADVRALSEYAPH